MAASPLCGKASTTLSKALQPMSRKLPPLNTTDSFSVLTRRSALRQTQCSRLAPSLRSGAPAMLLSHSRREQRDSSSRAVSKMGELSSDKFGASPTVQGAEYVMTQFDRLANWARTSSMWPMTFGLA